ncbi:MAG: PQQ-binding-like beta-propeller repeat protein, partial [Pirellulaceae bacterium]
MKSNQPWFVVLILAVVFGVGGDWPRFRGGDSNSIALDAKPPTELSEGNVAWKKELPGRGPSSPIVVDGKVLVTCSDGVKQDRIYVVCFDVDSGDELW